MMETITVKLNDEQMAKIIYKVTEKMMLDANRIEVVRCKDCKFGVYEKGRGIYHTRCEILEFLFQDDDYCSYGERKEE